MSNVPIHGIAKICKRNEGSILQVALIDPSDLSVQPDWGILPNLASGAISFKPGKAAYLLSIDFKPAGLSDDTDTKQLNGDVINVSLSFRVRNIRVEVDFLRAKLLNRRVHILVTLRDGQKIFYPLMRMAWKAVSGESPGQYQGYNVTAVAQYASIPPQYQGTLSLVGGNPTPPPAPPSAPEVTTTTITSSSSNYTLSIPAGKLLVAVVVRSNAAQTVQLGTSPGGAELGGPVDLSANTPLTMETVLRPFVNTNIYLSGLSGTNTIEIWQLG